MSQRKTVIDILDQAPHPLSLSHFREQGIDTYLLRRMVESGEIENPARGIYVLPGRLQSQHSDWALVSMKAPGSVVALMSAAAFHDLTQDMPDGLTLYVEHAARRNVQMGEQFLLSIDAISTRRKINLTEGVDIHQIEGIDVAITSPERTLVDMFRFSPFHQSLQADQVRVSEEAFLDMLNRAKDRDGFDFDLVRTYSNVFGCRSSLAAFTKTARFGQGPRP